MKLGRRVLIVGPSAVGKTNLASRLSKKLKLEVVHMDSIMWRPGWDYVGDKVTNQHISNASSKDRWIIEGYIAKESRKRLVDRADVVIRLDFNPYVNVYRYLKRCFLYRKHPRPELPGSLEKFNFRFMWVVFTKGELLSFKEELKRAEKLGKLVTLYTPKEVDAFVESAVV